MSTAKTTRGDNTASLTQRAGRFIRRLARRAAPAELAATRFVVLARYRSGSNLLTRALQTHPGVRVMPEIYNISELAKNPRAFRDPAQLARDAFTLKYPGAPNVAGFKLMYEQCSARELEAEYWGPNPSERILAQLDTISRHIGRDRDAALQRLASVWASLREDTGLHVVHLRRRNHLHSFVSFQLALREDNWVGRPYSGDPIRLDPERCEAWCERGLALDAHYAAFFSDHRLLTIDYEDLAGRFDASLERAFTFLGVPPVAVAPPIEKQRSRELRSVIANFDELEASLRRHPWGQAMLVASHAS